MNSTTAMADAAEFLVDLADSPAVAQEPETPIVQAQPVPQLDTDTSARVRDMHAGAQLGWTNGGGMVEQQTSANAWARAAEAESAAMHEMTDSRQAQPQYSWSDPAAETAEVTQSAGIGQSQ